jgi:hypothetical protein
MVSLKYQALACDKFNAESPLARDDAEMSLAWKFLDERSRGIFSGFTWPRPGAGHEVGAWVDSGDVVACERGVHACDLHDLAWWMSAQLWEIELDGPVIADLQKVVAPRGRLVRLVAEWPSIGGELAEWAVWRVRDHVAYVLDAVGDPSLAERVRLAHSLSASVEAIAGSGHDSKSAAGVAIAQLIDAADDVGNPILACHDAARAAGHTATITYRSIETYKSAFAAERLLQSRWIAARLGLVG